MMEPGPTEERPACASGGPPYFFSIWSYEDRAFLRGLYKRFACTKVHLMLQIMKASPGPPWSCSHWRMWQNMAREVRSSLKWQVSPKKIEDFFWEVIADGTGHYDVTERLDALIFGDGVSPAGPAQKSRALRKSTVTEDESTSPEDNQEEVSDDTCEYDEVVADDDRDADFTVSPAKLARVVLKRVKVARKCAKVHTMSVDQQRPAHRAPDSAGSEKTILGKLVAIPDSVARFVLHSVPSEGCTSNHAGGEGDAFARRQLPVFIRDAGSGGGDCEDEDDTGVYGERIPPRSAQPSVAGDGRSPALVRDRPPPVDSGRPSSVCDSANGTADIATSDSQLPRISGEARLDEDDLALCYHAKKPRFSVSTEPYVGDDEPMLDDDLPRSYVAIGTVSPASSIQLPEPEANRATANSVDQEVQCKPTCVDAAVQCEIDSTGVAEMMHREHLLRMEVLLNHRDELRKKIDSANT
ncbi:hypothetical protein HPB49_024756 [Dermacentor silvarum]|uniref:Uncharacterized protein n=1 Tax=Dermacentor silvarum TaxID=543639 RepID=A0ACB8CCC9_DERSI|nr:hypothetical protein HPB49_024756 [Dermacentor silvarum]